MTSVADVATGSAPSSGSAGVGQPLVVLFNHHPVTDKATAAKALQVSSGPPQQGSWCWTSATEAHYRPAAYWQPGTTITLAANLFGVNLGNNAYGQLNRSETVRIHNSWVAKANGSSHEMHVFHNGVLVQTMPISIGSAKNPSRDGPHVVSDSAPWSLGQQDQPGLGVSWSLERRIGAV